MGILDFSEQTLGMRFLAAVVVLLVSACIAAAVVVFAMMLVLFSADGNNSGQSNALISKGAWAIGGSLGAAVLLPPILVLLKAPTNVSLLPAAIGFLVAGMVTMWLVLLNLGTG